MFLPVVSERFLIFWRVINLQYRRGNPTPRSFLRRPRHVSAFISRRVDLCMHSDRRPRHGPLGRLEAGGRPRRSSWPGIYVDRKDNKGDFNKGDLLTLLADGEEEPRNYTLEGADKKTLKAMKSIFPASRMRIAYKQDGDVRHIVGVEKLVGRPTGVFVGEVMFVKGNFWVAVKPKNGPPDAFALGSDPSKGGRIVETLKSLQKGRRRRRQVHHRF